MSLFTVLSRVVSLTSPRRSRTLHRTESCRKQLTVRAQSTHIADDPGVRHTYVTSSVQMRSSIVDMGSPHQLTVFSPPGIAVESYRYPTVLAGVLVSTTPSEHLAIFDHPETWLGLDRESIASMRRSLYHLAIPIDTRAMSPSDSVRTLQAIALSATPVAIDAEVQSLPPRHILPHSGMLPTVPTVIASKLDILSEPETSKMAERITQKDIPAHDAVWQLLDYDYSLDQVARLFSVGLLGRHASRRMVPTRGAYKAVIDAFVVRALQETEGEHTISESRVYATNMLGENFVVLMRPGPSRVDYLRVELTDNGVKTSYSLQEPSRPSSDPRTSMYADHVRFAAFSALLRERKSAHITVFHHADKNVNSVLGAWVARAGVTRALSSKGSACGNLPETLRLLDTILVPDLDTWLDIAPVSESETPENGSMVAPLLRRR